MIDEKGILKRLEVLSSVGLPYLIETWQAAIDPAVWTIDLGGTTGSVLRDITEEPYQKVILAGAANADTARLHTVSEWQLGANTWGANTFNKLLIMEWEAKFANVADIENTAFFMGLAAGVAATRATMNIAGFILTADALNSITDNGGVETVNAVGAPVLTNWMKLAIVAYNGMIEFYVNEVMQARHVTNLPEYNVHGMFYLPQEAAVNTGELHIATASLRPGVVL